MTVNITTVESRLKEIETAIATAAAQHSTLLKEVETVVANSLANLNGLKGRALEAQDLLKLYQAATSPDAPQAANDTTTPAA